jgi:tRNA1(Val) A37 N6-methylase TrmN6
MSFVPMAAEPANFEITEDAVLGGRLRVRQPKRGHRVGHDAILVAAATGARTGERAVDLGAGVGAAGLALAARVTGLNVTLVEIDRDLCGLAADNVRLNGLDERVRVVLGDAEDAEALAAGGLQAGTVDRVLMNPPFNIAGQQQASPDARRRRAHVGESGLLSRWVATAATLLKPQGVLTLIWRADGLPEVRDALKQAFGSVAVLPVLPRDGANAIRVLVRAVKSGAAGEETIYPPLSLNDAQGKPTAAAEAVLRAGEALSIATI